MPMFPDAWMAELLGRNDIVSVVSEYVALSSKGRRMWGCCPFHNEKTPSFSVTADKQLYYCFGCHAGGGVIQFIMEAEKLPYVDAIKHLAARAGMELPGEVDDDRLRLERAHRERLYAACKEAARFYHDCLMGEVGKAAQRYLQRRGIDGRTAKRFGLGFAPDAWDALRSHLGQKGYADQELIDAGLAIRGKQKESIYDAYRNRLIFPIIGTNGRVIGFGARTLGKDEPKYINTGDTLIFNKRRNLYALNMQKGKQLYDLVMVEGYMDVISLYKHGIDNVVASLGTALTQQQARLIKRYAPRVYICYDGDAAGQNAMLRGLDILAKEGLEVRVITIPDDLDPDDFVKKFGRDAFVSLKDGALTLNGYKLLAIERDFDLGNEDGREGFAKRACAFVSTLQPVERERYVSVIARKTGLLRDTIFEQCGAVKAPKENSIGKYRNTRIKKTGETLEKRQKTERMIVACMARDKDAALHVFERMAEEGIALSNSALCAFAEAILVAYAFSDELDMARAMAALPKEVAEGALQALALADDMEEPARGG